MGAQLGVLALPSIVFFHNGRTAGKYNFSEFEVAKFAQYVTTLTGLPPEKEPEVLEKDWMGPLPSKEVPETDYYLWLAWAFIAVCAARYFAQSSFCNFIVESARNTWREAQIQHEHQD